MPQEEYEAERAVIAGLEALDTPATSARIEAAGGHTGEEVAEILDRLRAAAPDDPFWRGVAETRVEDRAVTVRFHAGLDPRDVNAGSSRLQCHLYDEEALAAADAAREGRSTGRTVESTSTARPPGSRFNKRGVDRGGPRGYKR
jgi:hypothetical protein